MKKRRNMASYKILLLPGDGIGPEVTAEVEKVASVISKAGLASFEFEKAWSAARPMTRMATRSAKRTWRWRKPPTR